MFLIKSSRPIKNTSTVLLPAGIVNVRKEETGARLILTFREASEEHDMPLAQYKSSLQEQIKGLDEQRQDVNKNTFASRITGEFHLGGGGPMMMEVLKKNEQLSRDERLEKTMRLQSIDSDLKKRRGMLQVLSHLQVHAVELLPEWAPKPVLAPTVSTSESPSAGKQIWARGVKSAALLCLAESRRAQGSDRVLLEICRRFLLAHTISDEPDYTPEQLFNNARQIRLLDSLDT